MFYQVDIADLIAMSDTYASSFPFILRAKGKCETLGDGSPHFMTRGMD